MELETAASLVSIFVGFATACLAYIGARGLNQWREQLKGQSRYELARRITLLAFQFEEQYHNARGSWIEGHDLAARQPVEGEHPDQKSTLDQRFAKLVRLEPLYSTFLQLRQACWEADILFDDQGEAREAFVTLEKCYAALTQSIRDYFEQQLDRRLQPRSWSQDDITRSDQLKRVVYGIPTDEHGEKVNEGVKALTGAVRRYVR